MWISLQSLNDGCGGTLIKEFVLHPIHIGSYVLEELVIALTEVVETRFTISGMGETIFRTFSIASKEILTFATLTGQRLLFGLTKCLLARRIHHVDERIRLDIAQLILREDEVVTRINITIPLYRSRMTTRFGQSANTWLLTNPIGKGGVEELNIIVANIIAHPFIEYSAKEVAPLLRGYTKLHEDRKSVV